MTKLPKSYCDLQYDTPALTWDDGLPLGNGQIGCLVWGTAEALRLSLDRGDLWDSTPSGLHEMPYFCYEDLVERGKRGAEEELREKYTAFYDLPTPTKLPAGRLMLSFPAEYKVRSRLVMATAHAELQVGPFEGEGFVCAEQNVGYLRLHCPASAFSMQLQRPEFGSEHDEVDESLPIDSLKRLHYPAPKWGTEGNCRWYVQGVGNFEYGVFFSKQEKDGAVTIAYTVAASTDGPDWKQAALARLAAPADTYERDFKAHTLWWENYWSESSVTLPEKLFEKNWYLINYLLGACSRKGFLPMPLQGVWTADNGAMPPWKGDYHHDLNTQMSYYSYWKANHLQAGESFLDYLWDMVPQAREFARSFYHAPGLCLPSVMSPKAYPMSGWPMYTLSPTNQLWLCQSFERHYRATGDENFLKERVYPYFRESTECVLSLMKEDERGYLVLPVSSSPEIHNDTKESWVTPNSNYDLSLIRYAVQCLIEFSKLAAPEETSRWEQAREKLPELAVTQQGVLKISPDEELQESHRHFAHAMAIHPLRLLDPYNNEDREIIDATVQDMERLGTGFWVGFSFPWMSEFYALQHNGEGAAYQLRVFWDSFCSRCGFNLNGDFKNHGVSWFHYRPFTLEGTMCAADALQEMLLNSENGILEFFPAIPQSWRQEKTSFESFRGENGLLVSACLRENRLVRVCLKAERDTVCRIRGNQARTLCFLDGQPVPREGDLYCFSLKAGDAVYLCQGD